mmetsp:Transcript_19156/g.47838  ORF Transcript_19156/g.47838 Transcript_19156/m.47838 type:complete len:236 (+) Transcript_19156:1670-2377(+)
MLSSSGDELSTATVTYSRRNGSPPPKEDLVSTRMLTFAEVAGRLTPPLSMSAVTEPVPLNSQRMEESTESASSSAADAAPNSAGSMSLISSRYISSAELGRCAPGCLLLHAAAEVTRDALHDDFNLVRDLNRQRGDGDGDEVADGLVFSLGRAELRTRNLSVSLDVLAFDEGVTGHRASLPVDAAVARGHEGECRGQALVDVRDAGGDAPRPLAARVEHHLGGHNEVRLRAERCR